MPAIWINLSLPISLAEIIAISDLTIAYREPWNCVFSFRDIGISSTLWSIYCCVCSMFQIFRFVSITWFFKWIWMCIIYFSHKYLGLQSNPCMWHITFKFTCNFKLKSNLASSNYYYFSAARISTREILNVLDVTTSHSRLGAILDILLQLICPRTSNPLDVSTLLVCTLN